MSGFSFGAPAAAVQPAAAAGSFSFGKPATNPPAFGAATAFAAPATSTFATQPASNFATQPASNFATQPASQFAAPTAATFAAPAANSFNFGTTPATQAQAPTSTAPLSFGSGTGAGLGGAFGGGGGNTAFSFSKPAATAAPTLNFGTNTTSAGTGLFAKPLALATTTAAATSAPVFIGLGGVDISTTQPKIGDSKQDIKVKETQVPEEIAKTVDALKTQLKLQKTLSSDIGRTSTTKLSNVSGGIKNLQWALQDIANSVETNYKHIKLLRQETNKTIQSVEMAQRTQDTPAGLQFENIAPFQYFQNLVAKYEQDLFNFRQQIEQTESHMHSLTNPQAISPEDLKRGFQQINESFISLAGRLHEINQKVEAQKEQYLNLRKYRLRDATNVFEQLDHEVKAHSHITSGPTPFSNITAMGCFGKTFSNNSGQPNK